MTHQFTAAQKAACAEREAKMRRRVYPRWVNDQRMSRDAMDREIALMEAIAADYRAQVQGSLLL